MFFSKAQILALVAAVSTVSAAVLEVRATNTNLQTAFPASTGSTAIAAAKTIAAGVTFDGGMKKWDRSGRFAWFNVLLVNMARKSRHKLTYHS
jgi:hypothetical protein